MTKSDGSAPLWLILSIPIFGGALFLVTVLGTLALVNHSSSWVWYTVYVELAVMFLSLGLIATGLIFAISIFFKRQFRDGFLALASFAIGLILFVVGFAQEPTFVFVT